MTLGPFGITNQVFNVTKGGKKDVGSYQSFYGCGGLRNLCDELAELVVGSTNPAISELEHNRRP